MGIEKIYILIAYVVLYFVMVSFIRGVVFLTVKKENRAKHTPKYELAILLFFMVVVYFYS